MVTTETACYQIIRSDLGDGAQEYLIPVQVDDGDLAIQITTEPRGAGDLLGICDLDGEDIGRGNLSWEWALITLEQAEAIADDWATSCHACEVEAL